MEGVSQKKKTKKKKKKKKERKKERSVFEGFNGTMGQSNFCFVLWDI